MTYDWQDRWQRNDIRFHLNSVNPLLKQYWPQLNLPTKANVLVPLCGKSLDMLWLMQQGYHVIGAELSNIACEAFFTEHNLPFQTEKVDKLTRYYNDQIEIFCGDYFELSKAMLPPIDAVYDRAALMALPKEVRKNYAAHTQSLLTFDTKILLIVIETQNEIKGPPFSVAGDEIKKIYSPFYVTELARLIKEVPPHWQQKGHKVEQTFEVVYELTKR